MMPLLVAVPAPPTTSTPKRPLMLPALPTLPPSPAPTPAPVEMADAVIVPVAALVRLTALLSTSAP